jgi:hypothetical protein
MRYRKCGGLVSEVMACLELPAQRNAYMRRGGARRPARGPACKLKICVWPGWGQVRIGMVVHDAWIAAAAHAHPIVENLLANEAARVRGAAPAFERVASVESTGWRARAPAGWVNPQHAAAGAVPHLPPAACVESATLHCTCTRHARTCCYPFTGCTAPTSMPPRAALGPQGAARPAFPALGEPGASAGGWPLGDLWRRTGSGATNQ